jgi:hypothetical protein
MRFLCPLLFAALATFGAAQSAPSTPSQPGVPPNLAGVWVLNPALTVRPAEIGFSPDWARGVRGGEGSGASGGGRGRRRGSGGSGSLGGSQMPSESAEDGTRIQQLTDEARTPPNHLAIVQKPDSVSIADDQGRSRTFHPNDRREDLTIGTVPLPTTAHWDAGSLVVVYEVMNGRQLRYTYTPSAKRLLVDIRFIEKGREGDEVRLTYEQGDDLDRVRPAAAAPAVPGTVLPPSPERSPGPASVLPPGSELRGIKTISTVIEDLSAQAAACGLDQSKIKTPLARLLADAGFNTQPVGREDADLVVSVLTSKLPDGVCVSRYDVSLVSHADATFPYLKGTVAAVEVQLLHDGGMAGGSPSAHASSVMQALTKSVNHFVAQIRGADK